MMNNAIMVARKEFTDLASSRLMLIVLAWYAITSYFILFNMVYPFDGWPSILSRFDNVASGIFVDFAYTLCYSGSIVGIVLGFVAVASEVDGKALNTLLVKPLYRDTIINGKLLGGLGFVLCLFGFTSAFYFVAMSIYSIVVRDALGPLLSIYIPTFISYLPLVLVLSLLCIMLTYSITLLMCLLFKNQSLALFISLFIWVILFVLIDNVSFAGNIGLLVGDEIGYFIGGFSVHNMLYFMLSQNSIQGVLANWWSQFFMLFLYCFTAIVLAYIAFLRRDVA
ncbi:ABC-type transport system involved in multi-copper enzyme maturation, permease component [Methanocella conradii HZ254]|uniref:ABC-type transport system involved in multi-copper enzyme maturation, permease component n=1 Tax=Methanocella conradii (strain DSM 24694 / JCM 17849 / CGMCC 1.5162 / HZ254) TaxID=1041930 RepID=H8I7R2_METCZ|nr:ABC transporter permease subunit [Methanocella conradii]AFC99897.1 ABC-type transport system involved in multi-copper enzyme maturation, permease component [Methanocella conradii HZ254]MDI6897244.1 ABC transporter permease subunit [Methanocella conradii]